MERKRGPERMVLRAVVFDLDETILVEYASVERAFRRAIAGVLRMSTGFADGVEERLYHAIRRISSERWLGSPAREYCLSVGISSWEALRARFVGHHPALGELRAWAPEFQVGSWAAALGEAGVLRGDLASPLLVAFRDEMERPPTLYPYALDVLRLTSARLPLGLLTNGLAELQGRKIDAAGIGDRFHSVVISGSLGVGKPAPEPFLRVLEGLGVDPHEAVMVGNSLRSDIAGAQNVGISTVWVRRPGAEEYDGVTPDVVIPDLSGLPEALDSLS